MSQQTFLFNSDQLYRVGSVFDPIKVKSLTLECYDVEYHEYEYLFSVVGMEGRYATSYDWALVLNTPVNVELARQQRALYQQLRDLRETARDLPVQKISHVLEGTKA